MHVFLVDNSSDGQFYKNKDIKILKVEKLYHTSISVCFKH